MTKEIIEGVRKIVVPFVKKRLFEINYEGLGESDAKEFDEHMNEILDLATKALEQEPIIDINVPHKIAEFLSDWDGDENAKMEISVDDMREIAFVYTKKARIERQLKEKALEPESCDDCISRADVEQTVEDNILCYTHSNRPIDQDPDTDCHKAIRIALRMLRKDLRKLPPVTPRSLNPEADREESKAYCAECDHIEMCSWYPHDGCEWLKTDRYNAGYNAAKREITLSGEYERAYERGKADAQPKIGRWKKMVSVYDMIEGKYRMIPYTHKDEELSNPPFYVCDCGNNSKKPTHYCPDCGTKMIDVPDFNDGKLSEIPTSSESEVKDDNCAGNDQNA